MSNVIRFDADADGRERESIEAEISAIDEVIAAISTPKPSGPPSTEKVEANRRNAKNSTGPKSAEGKRASSRNACKHGLYASTLLLPEEDAEQYAALCDLYEEEFQPQGLFELNLVEELLACKWKQMRLNTIERGVYDVPRDFLKRFRMPQPTITDILMESGRDRTLDRVYRVSQMESRLKREYNRAAKELRQLQSDRRSAAPEPPPEPEPAAAPETMRKPAERSHQSPHPRPPLPPDEGIAGPPDPRVPASVPPPDLEL